MHSNAQQNLSFNFSKIYQRTEAYDSYSFSILFSHTILVVNLPLWSLENLLCWSEGASPYLGLGSGTHPQEFSMQTVGALQMNIEEYGVC